MKALNKISQILAIVFGVGSLVLFFAPFVKVFNGLTVKLVGAQLAFGPKVTVGDAVYNLATSDHVLFVFCIVALAVVMSVFAYKAKALRFGSSIASLIAAVYMWVIALSKDGKYFEVEAIKGITTETNTIFVLITAIVLTVFAALAIAYLFIDDYLEAKASKDKKTICQKVGLFLRDNKSEIKKIVWPGPRDVLKNTVTVLVICLIIGAMIWAIDFGLGELLKLISKLITKSA